MVKQNDEAKKAVKKASKIISPVEHYKCVPSKVQTSDGEALKLEYFWSTHLSDSQRTWIFDLFDKNMEEMYRKSEWGYEENSKKAELFATTSRYIIVTSAKGEHIAYMHYRFVIEVEEPALYIYELQVEQAYQNKGVGTLLISIVELVAKRANMKKLFATVFTYNTNSLAFFRKNKFEPDENYQDVENEHDYYILSKKTTLVED
ncbi:unnamed protein product [Bursaphelenchus xylophilus]|uniref:N-alpha-acetyltransferase 40 n=1 Tax=Bursaphelenchus xylophilus TaxID=6326 RepID=A0A1I7RNM1_BURXY|nr:unnamed protein product [Bursaphelenchus xylophilus]CAG9124154.1 unnamed protein product [Bursaphelenchus xylophilus]